MRRLSGPTGSGKDELAKLFLENSDFSNKKVFEIDPATLLEEDTFRNTVFGHCKESFSGAMTNHLGLIREPGDPDGDAVVLLDDVHKASKKNNDSLHKFIETGKYNRLGDAVPARRSHTASAVHI